MKMLSPEKSQNKNIYFVAMLLASASTGGVAIVPQIGYSTSNIRAVTTRDDKNSHGGQLDNVRDGLGITVTALCKAFGVSRQAYYNWVNGDTPASSSRELLSRLSAAADLIRDLPGSKSVLLSQPLLNGKSFWRLVGEGQDPTELAQVVRDRALRRSGERSAIRAALERKKSAGTLSLSSDEFVG
jgi:transcriptional regulator with XRE-family HTH domain